MPLVYDEYDFRAYFEGIEKYFTNGKFMEVLQPEVERALRVVQGAIIRRLPSGASKELRASPRTSVKLMPFGFQGDVFIEQSNAAYKYASVVEYGRRPGAKQPPWNPNDGYIKSFMDWIKMRVRIAHQESTGKKLGKSQRADAMYEEAAFLVARAISKRGLAPKYPFKLGFAETQEQAFQIISYGVEKALAAINE